MWPDLSRRQKIALIRSPTVASPTDSAARQQTQPAQAIPKTCPLRPRDSRETPSNRHPPSRRRSSAAIATPDCEPRGRSSNGRADPARCRLQIRGPRRPSARLRQAPCPTSPSLRDARPFAGMDARPGWPRLEGLDKTAGDDLGRFGGVGGPLSWRGACGGLRLAPDPGGRRYERVRRRSAEAEDRRF
jgi:hypothetical protein